MRYLCLLLVIVVVSCQHRPVEELVLADVAVKAAQKVKADALAPDTYRKAENYYLRAKRDFSEGYFDSCAKYANDARLFAEQAEYQSLLKQTQLRNHGYTGGDPSPQGPGEY